MASTPSNTSRRKSLKVMSRGIPVGLCRGPNGHRPRPASHVRGRPRPVRRRVRRRHDPGRTRGADQRLSLCIDENEFDFARWDERAIGEMYPLWMLKYLPNMPACHVAIAHDARGPNNTIVLGEASSLWPSPRACA